MTEPMIYTFRAGEGLSAQFSYDRERKALEVEMSREGMSSRTLAFNNIGDADPIDFVSHLNWFYVHNQLFDPAQQVVDVIGTLARIDDLMRDPGRWEIAPSPGDIRRSREETLGILAGFEGNEEVTALALSGVFRTLGITGDTRGLVVTRQSPEADDVLEKIWDPLHAALVEAAENMSQTPFEADGPADNTVRIDNAETGIPFTMRVVMNGDAYGKDMALTHEADDPLIEFYDARSQMDTDPLGRPLGQFVSRYRLSTLDGTETPFTRSIFSEGRGLDLQTDVADWTLDASAIAQAREALVEMDLVAETRSFEMDGP